MLCKVLMPIGRTVQAASLKHHAEQVKALLLAKYATIQ
jgi:hypothetical protein